MWAAQLTAEWARLGKSSLSLDLTVNTHRDLLVPLPYDVKALFVCEVIRGLITSANMNVATNRAWFALMVRCECGRTRWSCSPRGRSRC